METRQGISYNHPLELVWSYAMGDFEPVDNLDTGDIESETIVRDRSAADKIYRGIRLYREGREGEGIRIGKLVTKKDLV